MRHLHWRERLRVEALQHHACRALQHSQQALQQSISYVKLFSAFAHGQAHQHLAVLFNFLHMLTSVVCCCLPARLAWHLLQDISDVERRAQAAELRHQELSAKLPEATAPLLRQISALQDASAAQVRPPTPVCDNQPHMCCVK